MAAEDIVVFLISAIRHVAFSASKDMPMSGVTQALLGVVVLTLNLERSGTYPKMTFELRPYQRAGSLDATNEVLQLKALIKKTRNVGFGASTFCKRQKRKSPISNAHGRLNICDFVAQLTAGDKVANDLIKVGVDALVFF